MRATLGLLAALLTACGGGGQEATVQAPPPQTVTPSPERTATVFIGDSITARWPLDAYLPTAVNVGISGDSTSQMLTRFNQDVLSKHPAVVVILGGTNDVPGVNVANPVNIFSMVQAAMSANAKVIVGTITPTNNIDRPDSLIRDFNAQLRIGAKQYGYELADYYPAMLLPDGSLNEAFFVDDLHPNADGYDAMWNVLEPILQRSGVVAAP